ncbi:MAG: polysaccharide deacetylase family protein [Solirubrobacterales bacterium]|nr:polysaccharide deacetylase family protein [Solirubrobacterales bacterium]
MSEVLVLCYHSVSESWPAPTSVRPGDIEGQLRDFLRRGYRGATFAEALTTPTAERTLVVTFDDAHRSVGELAAPLLERLGIPATVFVPTDYPDSGRPMGWDGYDIWLGTEHEQELGCMGWEELGALAERGWEIGSHTRSHPRLSRLGEAEIAAELAESRKVCEKHLQMPCLSLAYPYGDYDDRVVLAARDAGYRFAATIPRQPMPAFPLQWPRVGVYHGEEAGRIRRRAWTRQLAPHASARVALALRRLKP